MDREKIKKSVKDLRNEILRWNLYKTAFDLYRVASEIKYYKRYIGSPQCIIVSTFIEEKDNMPCESRSRSEIRMYATVLLVVCCFLCPLCAAGDDPKPNDDASSSSIGTIDRCNFD